MKIAILGASGQTGTQLIAEGLAAGHDIIGLARTPENIASDDPRVTKLHGDAFDEQSVIDGLAGADAVVTTVGKNQSARQTLLGEHGGPQKRARRDAQTRYPPADRDLVDRRGPHQA